MKFGLVLHKIIFAYFSSPAGANQSMMQLRLCFIAFYRVLVVNDCFETLLRSADASWLVDGWRQFDVQNGSCRLFFFFYISFIIFFYSTKWWELLQNWYEVERCVSLIKLLFTCIQSTSMIIVDPPRPSPVPSRSRKDKVRYSIFWSYWKFIETIRLVFC